jgi:hypothetical protein
MAAYLDLIRVAAINGDLQQQVQVACFIQAGVIQGEPGGTSNHTNRMLWAKAVYQDPEREGRRMLWAVLAANNTATLAQIQSATDAQVQTAVAAAVDLFANGQP